jgi:hypothetical protein
MSAGRPSRGGRAASCRVAIAALAALVGLGVLVAGASTAFAQSHPGQQPTTTTTSPPTTTTRPAPPTTTTSPPTTAPPTSQETAPPATAEPPPPPANDGEPVVEEESAEEAAAAAAYEAQGITFTTVANLLVPGDGTDGAQATTTTTAPAPDEGSSADDENRLIWMIIAGLAGVAVLVAVLTWRYWLLTRPGLVVEGDAAEDVRRGAGGPGYGGAAPPGRRPSGGRGGADAFWDEPRDPRRTFVGPPDAGGAPGGSPAPGAPIPGRQGADAGPEGARRRRGGPGAPGSQGGPGGPGGQGGRGATPPPGRRGPLPGSSGDEPSRRRRAPGSGPTRAQGGPPASGGRRGSQSGERDPRGGDTWFRRAQPEGDGARAANTTGPTPARRAAGRPPGGGRAQPPGRPQPLADGRSMRDTDIWAPGRRR